jgi:hypothetical protein
MLERLVLVSGCESRVTQCAMDVCCTDRIPSQSEGVERFLGQAFCGRDILSPQRNLRLPTKRVSYRDAVADRHGMPARLLEERVGSL